MREKLYTIPVNEAYDYDCECPLCYIKKELEVKAIDFTMGPSYMEDDIRAETDKVGFCSNHLSKLYENQNRLGLALMLKTHMDYMIKNIEKTKPENYKVTSSLFQKKENSSPTLSYLTTLENSCFICDKISNTFERYIVTIFTLYKSEPAFREKCSRVKGYCTNHYSLLYEKAPSYLRGNHLDSFISDLNKVFLDNMKRVRDDLDWFTDKFDYRFKDAPWKNSKDALPRAMTKTNGIY